MKNTRPTKLVFSFLFTLLYLVSGAQTLKVFSESYEGGIPKVHIDVNDSLHLETNNVGEVKLPDLNDGDILTFEHPSFYSVSLSYQTVKNQNFQVKMSESEDVLPPAIVTYHKWEEDLRKVPVQIQLIDPEKQEFYNPQTTADLLGSSGQVYVQKSQLGGGSPMVRGFSANRVLLVMNGVRMNNAIFRSGNLQNSILIDPNSLEEAEIVFGPGSVIYGSDALGGVFDFHTLELKPHGKDTTLFYGKGSMGFSSANNSQNWSGTLGIQGKKLSLISTFTTASYSDLRMGNPDFDLYRRFYYQDCADGKDTMIQNRNSRNQIGTAYSQINSTNKISYTPSKYWELNYDFLYSESSDIPRYDRLIENVDSNSAKYAEWYYGPQKWNFHSFSAEHSKKNSLYDNLRFTFGLQAYEESRNDRRFNSDILRQRRENVLAFSVNADFWKQFNDSSRLFYGVEVVDNTVSSVGWEYNIVDSSSQKISSRYPDDATWRSMAIYLNHTRNVGKKGIFSAGVRWNLVEADARLSTEFYDFPTTEINIAPMALSGSMGYVYKLSSIWRITSNVSTGFRAPNMDDLAKVFDSEPGSVVVPNNELEPEYAYNFDLGFKGSDKKNYYFELNAFASYLQNAMVRADYTFNGMDSIMYDGTLSQVQAIQNLESAIIYGVNTHIKWLPTKNYEWNGTFSYNHGEDSNGDILRHIPPHFYQSHFIYKRAKIRSDIYVEGNLAKNADQMPPNEQDRFDLYPTNNNGETYVPSWVTLNYAFQYKVNEHFRFTAGVKNILNEGYRPYASGIVAPGRDYFIKLSLNV